MAGAVVGIVALPLSMALAIASGVPPKHGLYTAVVAGLLIAAAGGSRVQVSGPTAAFVVILVPISHNFGIGGLLLASLMAGLLLVAMGVARLGRMMEFVPYPVTTGFTAGIAVVIGTMQVKDFLGLRVAKMPEHWVEQLGALFEKAVTARWPELVISVLALAILLLFPRFTRKVPAALAALTATALVAWIAHALWPSFSVETIGSRFGGIPQTPPLPVAPWHFPGADGRPLHVDFALVRALFPSAVAIAILGAIESLLSAVVADGMSGHRHDPDVELVAQGAGNIVAPFFGGFAATGAIARTATSVRAGARSPVASIVHALVVLLAIVLLAPLLGFLPMAALAALLLTVAWNMSEREHFIHMLRSAPRSDVAVLLTCFALTVLFDMVVAVTVGVVLAALLFMKRMSEVADFRLVDFHPLGVDPPLPRGVALYEVAGPLFFGAAQQALRALEDVDPEVRVIIVDLRSVPAMDATALVALESAFEELEARNVFVILGGVQPQPLRTMARARWRERRGRVAIYRSFDRAIDQARRAFA